MESDNLEQLSAPAKAAFWPILVLSLAFSIYLIFQAFLLVGTTPLLKQQLVNVTQQVEKAQNDTAASRNIQAILERLANDLLVLANTDSEAKKLTEKYQIRRISSPTH